MKTGDEQGIRQPVDRRWADNDASRRRQVREDATRSLAENLTEGLALSEFLSTFTGAARPR
jgi:hypothetical protein